jgi:hypothetical protein
MHGWMDGCGCGRCGVMRRIDVNDEVVSRIDIGIDINDLLDRVDLENILARIDWDLRLQLSSVVDLNSILRKIDINDIVGRRSDMGAIILAQSVYQHVRTSLQPSWI